MSHFTVLVIGENVDDQLAPFHEFECTGIDDQHIQEVDQTDEAWAEYCKLTDALVREDADHEWVSRYAPVCYREPTMAETAKIGPIAGTGSDGQGLSWASRDWGDGKGHRTRVHEVPTGWEEANLPTSERRSFAEFCDDHYGHVRVLSDDSPNLEGEHKYGYTVVDEAGVVVKTVRRTNPEAHWDWYLVGGRWSGFFLLKDGREGVVGQPRVGAEAPPAGRVDSVLKGDVDLETMRVMAGAGAGARWDGVHAAIAGRSFTAWATYLAEVDAGRLPWREAADGYREQPVVKDVQAWIREQKSWLEPTDLVWTSERDAYVQRARDRALFTHAVVKDGTWYEKGSMGSWAVISDEMDPQEWESRFTDLLDSLPDSARLTVVDCHI